MHFKFEDSKLSLLPDSPVYDPWTYDPGYMGKVIDDPNEYLDKQRDVDYADKVETEAPDTADRNVKTVAEQNDDVLQAGYAVAAATNSEDALASALDAISRGDLLGAGSRAAQAELAAQTAADAFNNSGNDSVAKDAAGRARAAADAAAFAVAAATP